MDRLDPIRALLERLKAAANHSEVRTLVNQIEAWIGHRPTEDPSSDFELRIYRLLARGFSIEQRLDEADKALRLALEIRSDQPDLLHQRGKLVFMRRDYEQAVRMFERARKLSPGSADILNDLGSARLATGDHEGAITALRNAIEIAPDLAMAHANLGTALAYRGDIGTPLKAFLRATNLAPEDHRIWLKMGRTLLNQGHTDTAEKCLRRALRLRPENPSARGALGALLERSGQYSEAMEILQPLVDDATQDTNAVVAWATTCNRLGKAKEAVPVLLRYIERPLSRPERTLIAHCLGDLYEKTGDYERAFRAHEQANESSRVPFDSEKHAKKVDSIIATFPAESFEQRHHCEVDDQTPVFIVGMPRSGTSLVEQIIDSHPMAAGAGELESLRILADSLCPPESCGDWMARMNDLSANQTEKIARSYLSKLRETSSDAVRITDKMPTNFMHLGLAGLILPEARVIHCTRNIRDTAISCYFKHFNNSYAFSTRLDWIGHFILAYQRLMAHWEQVLPIPILTVSYEDMVRDPEGQTRRIIEFLELP